MKSGAKLTMGMACGRPTMPIAWPSWKMNVTIP